jgi:exonuclease III
MIEKPLSLVSLNVRGLGRASAKPKEIKAWLASLQAPPQISLIQEHHIRKDDNQHPAKGKGLEFWRGSSFWNHGIPLGRSQRIRAGTTILIDRATTLLIKDHGILVDGKVQFVTLHSPDNGLLTIINVYASQTSTERALLWNRIVQADFISDHIILGGDFNHFDQGNTLGSRRMHRREVVAWHQMTLRYGLTDAWFLDSFHKQSEKEFTFDNRRTGRQSAVSRIDKFMVSQTVEERGGRIEDAASMRKFTDHSPVCIKIWGSLGPSQNTPGYFNVFLLSNERRKKDMLEAWIGEAPLPTIGQNWALWLEAATERITLCNRRLSKERKRAQGAQIKACTKKIQLAEI